MRQFTGRQIRVATPGAGHRSCWQAFAPPWGIALALLALTGAKATLAADQPSGTIVTVAGNGKAGFSGDGGPATLARLNVPYGVAVDAAGNLFFVDQDNNRLRKVSPAGIISTVAGTGKAGFSGDGGPATEARVDHAVCLALDQAGNLFFADRYNERVRKVSPEGVITTVAGRGPVGMPPLGSFAGDGGPATAARLNGPVGVAVDAAGNLFIADHYNQRIRRVSPDGIITTVAGSGPTGTARGSNAGDGGPATQARLNGPWGLVVDEAGNLFFSENGFDDFGSGSSGGYRVRKVSAEGIISTVAGTGVTGFSGDGGLATEARLNFPLGLAVDTAGNLFIADWNNYRVRKVDPNGIISTVAGIGRKRYVGDGALATATGLRGPVALAVDAAGNLLISDTQNFHEGDGLGANERVLELFGAAAPGLLAGGPFPASP